MSVNAPCLVFGFDFLFLLRFLAHVSIWSGRLFIPRLPAAVILFLLFLLMRFVFYSHVLTSHFLARLRLFLRLVGLWIIRAGMVCYDPVSGRFRVYAFAWERL